MRDGPLALLVVQVPAALGERHTRGVLGGRRPVRVTVRTTRPRSVQPMAAAAPERARKTRDVGLQCMAVPLHVRSGENRGGARLLPEPENPRLELRTRLTRFLTTGDLRPDTRWIVGDPSDI